MDELWDIVATARARGGDILPTLAQALQDRPIEARQRARDQYERAWWRAYDWGIWAAAFQMNDGCGDDSFMDFRAWLVLQGREVFEAALNDPDSLADVPFAGMSFESWEVAKVFEDVGTTMGRVEPPEGPRDAHGLPEPTGTPWRERDLPARLPRLSGITTAHPATELEALVGTEVMAAFIAQLGAAARAGTDLPIDGIGAFSIERTARKPDEAEVRLTLTEPASAAFATGQLPDGDSPAHRVLRAAISLAEDGELVIVGDVGYISVSTQWGTRFLWFSGTPALLDGIPAP